MAPTKSSTQKRGWDAILFEGGWHSARLGQGFRRAGIYSAVCCQPPIGPRVGHLRVSRLVSLCSLHVASLFSLLLFWHRPILGKPQAFLVWNKHSGSILPLFYKGFRDFRFASNESTQSLWTDPVFLGSNYCNRALASAGHLSHYHHTCTMVVEGVCSLELSPFPA